MNIYTFEPLFKSVIWGGDKIAALKQIEVGEPNIGESWELSSVPGNESVVADGCDDAGMTINELIDRYGEDLLGTRVYRSGDNSFPLLIKFIDAQRDLSVQVHPDDVLARKRHNSPGKTEMWYILDAEDGALIHCGLSAPLTPEGYRKSISESNIMDYVAAYGSHRGQFYFVPAGTLHAIGAGNLVAEIQQTSDITYRVYDYDRVGADGKPRQLHTDLACDAIDYTYPNVITPTALTVNETQEGVVRSQYFTVGLVKVGEGESYSVSHDGESFRILMITDGTLTIEYGGTSHAYLRGTTVLIPASVRHFDITGDGTALVVNC